MPAYTIAMARNDFRSTGPVPRSTPAPGGLVCVGRILGARGVRGEVRVRSHTADPRAIGRYGPVYTSDGGRSFRLTVTGQGTGAGAGTVFARLTGVADRDAAEALKGTELHVPRNALPATGAEEFYHADLVGLAAARSDGPALGRVIAVHNFGAGDVLEIGDDAGSVLVPFTSAAVPDVDLAARRLVVAPLPGLLDAAEAAPAAPRHRRRQRRGGRQ